MSTTKYQYAYARNQTANDSYPLRSKAFTQIDNIHHPHQSPLHTQDRISEIKKKYQGLVLKSSWKQEHSENINLQIGQNRPVSAFGANENYKVSTPVKQIQMQGVKEKKFSDSPEEVGLNGAAGFRREAAVKRNYTAVKNEEMKSQIESNRTTLSAMKSELQAKLNDLSNKTSLNSALKNQAKQVPKFNDQQGSTYEAIMSKYSKNTVPTIPKDMARDIPKEYLNRNNVKDQIKDIGRDAPQQNKRQLTREIAGEYYRQEYKRQPIDKLQTVQRVDKFKLDSCMVTSTVKPYNPKYVASKTKEMKGKQQLSIISQISNSNNSDGHKESLFDFEVIKSKHTLEKSYVKQKGSQCYETNQPNAESSIILSLGRQDRPEQKKWYKNTASYFDDHRQANNNYQKSQTVSKRVALQKLDSAQGFTITRTVTEQNLKNMMKVGIQRQEKQVPTSVQMKFAQKYENSKQISADVRRQILYQNHRQNILKNRQTVKQSNKSTKHETVPLRSKYEQQYKQTTFGKRVGKDLSIHLEQTANKYAIPVGQESENAKNQIQKLKIKYNISSGNNATSNQKKIEQVKTVKSNSNTKHYEPARNNQALSKQIQKLDQRIKEIQQNKKELNISFKPYDIKNNQTNTPTSAASNHQTNNFKDKYTQNKYIHSKPNARNNNYLDRVKPIYSEITLPVSQTYSSSFAIKLIPVQHHEEEQPPSADRSISQISSKSRTKQGYMNKIQFQARADNGMEQRKKRLQSKVQMNNTIKNMVKMFGQQAVFDELFRNNKIWFASEGQTKWESLMQQLKHQGIYLNQNQIKEQFQLLESQNNPFFSVTDNKCDYKTLVHSYRQATQHWNQKIYKQYSRQILVSEGFNTSRVDFDKKGYVQVQDLVRFLNIESGTFLRNRDVSIIFRRINKQVDRIRFQELLQVVSQ